LFSHVPPQSQMAVGMGLNDFFHTDGGCKLQFELIPPPLYYGSRCSGRFGRKNS
jgi:hypothetical protein